MPKKKILTESMSPYTGGFGGGYQTMQTVMGPYQDISVDNPQDVEKELDMEDPEYDGDDTIDIDQGAKEIKYKVTPDEIVCGLKHELDKQLMKNMEVAKSEVIKNLKENPKYYSSLHMMNIDPKDLNETISGKPVLYWISDEGVVVPGNDSHGKSAIDFLMKKFHFPFAPSEVEAMGQMFKNGFLKVGINNRDGHNYANVQSQFIEQAPAISSNLQRNALIKVLNDNHVNIENVVNTTGKPVQI